MTKKGKITTDTACTFAQILSPFAPHIAEELWQILGKNKSLAYEPWPGFNEEYLIEDTFNYPVSFNGKMRFNIELAVSLTKEDIIKIILADERAKKWIGNATPSNIIFVPNRIVNIVIKN
jgi:leucyl-tRNA synthetase